MAQVPVPGLPILSSLSHLSFLRQAQRCPFWSWPPCQLLQDFQAIWWLAHGGWEPQRGRETRGNNFLGFIYRDVTQCAEGRGSLHAEGPSGGKV
jgi:hypothetical protein